MARSSAKGWVLDLHLKRIGLLMLMKGRVLAIARLELVNRAHTCAIASLDEGKLLLLLRSQRAGEVRSVRLECRPAEWKVG